MENRRTNNQPKNNMIYIVDDSYTQNILLKRTLIEEGYKVRAFSSATHLIKQLETERPRLIISDIDMPGINGFELLQKVKETSCCKDIPFFFLSSSNTPEIKFKAKRFGAHKLFRKPLNRELLIPEISSTLYAEGSKIQERAV